VRIVQVGRLPVVRNGVERHVGLAFLAKNRGLARCSDDGPSVNAGRDLPFAVHICFRAWEAEAKGSLKDSHHGGIGLRPVQPAE